jgi:glycosyltransferase involved in cell wall biosynthesis
MRRSPAPLAEAVRIVFLTQVIDADHPALAQSVDLVRALAERCDEVVVVCDRVGRHDLPRSVRFRPFASRTRVGRAARFARAVATETAVGRSRTAVLAHMVPLYLLLAAPFARRRGAPLLLWYTHWHASRSLRLATRLADAVLSVERRTFPLETPKLVVTGHAIDVDAFRPSEQRSELAATRPLRVLAVGRTARWKGYETLLEGVRLALARGVAAELEIRGPSMTPDERRHRAELEATVEATVELHDLVRIEGPVGRERLPGLLAAAHVLVSPTQPERREAVDKAVLEAAACGLPVISSNPALDGLLDGLPLQLRFPPRDAAALAGLLAAFEGAAPDLRQWVGAELRRRVEAGHSLDSWADQVVSLAGRLAGGAAGARSSRT